MTFAVWSLIFSAICKKQSLEYSVSKVFIAFGFWVIETVEFDVVMKLERVLIDAIPLVPLVVLKYGELK